MVLVTSRDAIARAAMKKTEVMWVGGVAFLPATHHYQ